MKELCTALAAVKKKIGCTIHVDAQGQYGSYASLEQVLKLVEPACQELGLLVLQYTRVISGGFGLVTEIYSINNEQAKFTCEYLLTPDGPGPQKMGAAITYARRFALMTMFGLVSEGDPDSAAPQVRQHAPTPRTSVRSGETANKLIPMFKKYEGKRYGQCSIDELKKSMMWLHSEAKKTNSPLSSRAEEFCADVVALELELMSEEGPAFADSVPF